MQPPEQQQPPQQQPVIRRKYARRRLRDRKGIRRAQIGARGLLTGGAALILLGGSQAGLATFGGLSGDHHPSSAASSGGSIDGGSPGLGAGTPPGSTSLGPTQAPSAGSTPSGSGSGSGGPVVQGGGSIPAIVMAAYRNAQQRLAVSEPGCHLPWQLLAAIGEVESGQAEGGNVTADGTARSPILGPALNGNGFAAIRSGSGWARAEGPMQFIPSTWQTWGVDGNGDGKADPENVYDAALAAGDFLCSGSRDLSVQADLNRAIHGYNPSQAYVSSVLAWYRYYKANGAIPNAGVPALGGGANGAKTKSDPYQVGTGPDSTVSPNPGAPSTPRPPGSTPHPGGVASWPNGGSTTGGSTSPSSSPSSSPSASPTPTRSASPSPSSTPSSTPSTSPTSGSPSPSPTCASNSPSPSPSPSPTGSASPSGAASPSKSTSASPSAGASTSATAGASADPSATPSGSSSPTPTPAPTCS